jgi:glyceraldehyde 3-phosphate dehydrogenase
MSVRVGINGFGRIGRNVLRAARASSADVSVVAINDLIPPETNAHLLAYDSTLGRLEGVQAADGAIRIGSDEVKVFAERDPKALPWSELGVEVVIESTGIFTDGNKAAAHIDGGARRVIISAPATNVDATFVMGVNDQTFDPAQHTVVSNASCTTNCLAPMVKAIDDRIGVASGLMNTIHSFTNDQVLTDVFHKDLRRARSATHNMIPTKTGAAAAVGLVLPHLNGKLDGYSIRVPTINVSIVDLTFVAKRPTTVEEVNRAVKAAADAELKGVLEYNTEQLVSSDFNHNPASSIFDSTLTRVTDGTLVKVSSWYDNEWGFSNRMLDVAAAFAEVGAEVATAK